MAAKRKPTLKQLFKAWIKCQQKNTEAMRLKWELDDLANKVEPGSELIVHEGKIYRITTRPTFGGRVNYDVNKIADTDEIENIK